MEENITRVITDKQNSIEVSKNAKGDIQYAVKVYFNAEDADKTLELIKSLKVKIESDFKKEQI